MSLSESRMDLLELRFSKKKERWKQRSCFKYNDCLALYVSVKGIPESAVGDVPVWLGPAAKAIRKLPGQTVLVPYGYLNIVL